MLKHASFPEAIELFRKSADQGNKEAAYWYATELEEKKDYEMALEWYKVAAQGSLCNEKVLIWLAKLYRWIK